MELLSRPDIWVSFLTLTALEIVLGIDNIIFISILAGKLPAEQQGKARNLGLMLALVTRLGLLFAISWLMSLTAPLFSVMSHTFSGRDLILGVGGLFLIGKAAHEIFEKLEVHEDEAKTPKAGAFTWVIVQILLLDVVFSLDSVITAVGMVNEIPVMVAAMLVSVVIMLVFAGPISNFVNRHPSMKILALAFLQLVGVLLVAEAFGQHINRGYIYFAMAFSFVVELINIRVRKKQQPVHLHGRFEAERGAA